MRVLRRYRLGFIVIIISISLFVGKPYSFLVHETWQSEESPTQFRLIERPHTLLRYIPPLERVQLVIQQKQKGDWSYEEVVTVLYDWDALTQYLLSNTVDYRLDGGIELALSCIWAITDDDGNSWTFKDRCP